MPLFLHLILILYSFLLFDTEGETFVVVFVFLDEFSEFLHLVVFLLFGLFQEVVLEALEDFVAHGFFGFLLVAHVVFGGLAVSGDAQVETFLEHFAELYFIVYDIAFRFLELDSVLLDCAIENRLELGFVEQSSMLDLLNPVLCLQSEDEPVDHFPCLPEGFLELHLPVVRLNNFNIFQPAFRYLIHLPHHILLRHNNSLHH